MVKVEMAQGGVMAPSTARSNLLAKQLAYFVVFRGISHLHKPLSTYYGMCCEQCIS
jgi:hypothetical protein